ncbi:hypothetical protein F5B20DRAFT_557717 [Whalleya microplaca]|nr:hypothetical protein F5B20DRAFT_557717 [Whalleya microplaca]
MNIGFERHLLVTLVGKVWSLPFLSAFILVASGMRIDAVSSYLNPVIVSLSSYLASVISHPSTYYCFANAMTTPPTIFR